MLSIVLKMVSRVGVGYKFVSEPDDALKCLICHELARDPLQHEDCGKLFCKECLEEYYGRNRPCPNCRTSSQYYKDNKSELENCSIKFDIFITPGRRDYRLLWF